MVIVGVPEYVAAVARRWVWVAAAGVVGALLAVVVAGSAPETWRASTSLYITATEADGPEGTAFAARVRRDVIPSVAAVARSATVLEPVIDQLALPTTPRRLARDVELVVDRRTSIVELSVAGSSSREAAAVTRAVADQLQARSGELFDDGGTPLLSIVPVREATAPVWPEGPGTVTAALLGLLAGSGLTAVAAGLLESLSPRVRTARDVGRAGSLPLLGTLPAGAGGESRHRSATERLRLFVDPPDTEPAGTGRHGRLLVTGPAATAVVAALGRRLFPGREVVAVPQPGELRSAVPAPLDRVLVAASYGRTRVPELRRLLAEIATTPAPVLGVVLDGDLGGVRDRRTRVLAALRGDAPPLRDSRLRRVVDGSAATWSHVIAAAALALTGLDVPLPFGASSGVAVALALLPLWAPVVRRSAAASWLAGLASVGVVCGALLARAASTDHAFAPFEAASTALTILGIVGAVGVLLWARTLLKLPVVAAWFAAGMLVDGLLDSPRSPDPVKFELLLPVTLLVLALLSARARPTMALVALMVLAAAGLLHDARSAAGFCAVAAVLVLWQARPAVRPIRSGLLRPAMVLAGGTIAAYSAMERLLLSGALGTGLQARTALQIEQSGDLLLGGRPEWTATWALMRENPLGFGLGTVPGADDVALAKQGMSVARIPTAEGYIEHYLLAGRFELHSILADLWSNLGPVGLLMGLLISALLLRGLIRIVQGRGTPAVICYVALPATWALFFGPLPTDALVVALALGLLLPVPVPRGEGVPAAADPLPADVARRVGLVSA